MSVVKVQGNVSGTGAFTIAAPNSNTDRTLTLPDETGTVLINGTSSNVAVGTTGLFGSNYKFTVASGRVALVNNSDPYNVYLQYNSSTTGVFLGSPSANTFAISNGSGTEYGRFDASGNLLVGMTSTTSNARTNLQGTSGGRYALDCNINSTVSTWQISFTNPNGVVGSISTSGSTTTYSTSSDYRLKENVQPMAGALATVSALKPVTYTWKADGAAGQGFIAHELQEVIPDAVVGEKDAVDAEGKPIYQGIDTSFLVATLTAAIQEQQAQIEALKARLDALDGPSNGGEA